MDTKAPHALSFLLQNLYITKECLKHDVPNAARRAVAAALAQVQNELDWVYNSDIELLAAKDYLESLHAAIHVLPTEMLIDDVETLIQEIDHASDGRGVHSAPESYDFFELEARKKDNTGRG